MAEEGGRRKAHSFSAGDEVKRRRHNSTSSSKQTPVAKTSSDNQPTAGGMAKTTTTDQTAAPTTGKSTTQPSAKPVTANQKPAPLTAKSSTANDPSTKAPPKENVKKNTSSDARKGEAVTSKTKVAQQPKKWSPCYTIYSIWSVILTLDLWKDFQCWCRLTFYTVTWEVSRQTVRAKTCCQTVAFTNWRVNQKNLYVVQGAFSGQVNFHKIFFSFIFFFPQLVVSESSTHGELVLL